MVFLLTLNQDDSFVYGICEAIDGEKDPQCLMITFHIVNVLSRLFPDPAGPVASYAEDLFEILGRYFPIHFTHVRLMKTRFILFCLSYVSMYIYMHFPRLLLGCLLSEMKIGLHFSVFAIVKCKRDCRLSFQ